MSTSVYRYAGWSSGQLVLLHWGKVVGSNPAPATNNFKIIVMNRFKLICIGIVVMIFTAIVCSSCVANPNEVHSGYSIERIYKYRGNSLAIYKVKTPSKTYTICRDSNGGMVVLQ